MWILDRGLASKGMEMNLAAEGRKNITDAKVIPLLISIKFSKCWRYFPLNLHLWLDILTLVFFYLFW